MKDNVGVEKIQNHSVNMLRAGIHCVGGEMSFSRELRRSPDLKREEMGQSLATVTICPT